MDHQIGRSTWLIEGQELAMPVRIRHATMAAAVFACDVRAAETALAATPFAPVAVRGRALAVFVAVHYVDGDLGGYDEFGVEVVVRGPDRAIGVTTLDLPVTASFTRSAGRAIWGLPKYVTEGSILTEQRQTRIELSEGDRFIVSGSIASGVPVPGTFPGKLHGWSVGLEGSNDGLTLKTPTRMRLRGLRFRLGGNRMAWGDHPMAVTARSLGMSRRPLCSFAAGHFEAEIGDAVVVGVSPAVGERRND